MLYLQNRLIYEGQEVGKRVLYKYNKTQYDISNQDLQTIIEDYDTRIREEYGQDIILEARGDLLVPINAENVKELRYNGFAKLKGFDRMSKSDPDLKAMYNYYNKLCFNNELPKLVPVNWSTRMTSSAGICRSKRAPTPEGRLFSISLSKHYHERYPDEVIDTLVHEMIHVKYPREGHGKKFKQEMEYLNRKFGFSLTVYSSGRAKVNYVYECKECGYEYERTNRINLDRSRCGVKGCNGELFMREDHTEGYFDETDWEIGEEW